MAAPAVTLAEFYDSPNFFFREESVEAALTFRSADGRRRDSFGEKGEMRRCKYHRLHGFAKKEEWTTAVHGPSYVAVIGSYE